MQAHLIGVIIQKSENQVGIFQMFRKWRCESPKRKYVSKFTRLDVLFSSNHNIHKSSCGLCFWASDPLINRFYWNLSIQGSEAQKQRPHELLWMLWFDKKSISNQTHKRGKREKRNVSGIFHLPTVRLNHWWAYKSRPTTIQRHVPTYRNVVTT